MPKQRKLVEFAKDAALHIIASQPVNSKETLCKICGSNLIDGTCYDCLGDGGCR